MKGEKLLKITGIIMIVGGALATILAIVAFAGIALLVAAGLSSVLYLSAVLLLGSAVVELVAGIVGVKNCNKPEKAGTCITWGILVIALSLLGNILNAIGGSDVSVVNILVGLALPILYLIGAYQNKDSAPAA